MNNQYRNLLASVMSGEQVTTRNSGVYRRYDLPEFTIDKVPLITARRTAWRKALRELEWFLSGDPKCPPELLDWWAGQLDPDGCYVGGYGQQWRGHYDQINGVIEALRKHPYSRRHVLTTWNPGDMAVITEHNHNPNTPTTCHGTMVQLFVSGDTLHMHHYQRSSDMLLGLPHNLMQYWALLVYLAHRAGLGVGTITYKLGDAHIYDEPSHLQAADEIISADVLDYTGELIYYPTSEEFVATDFTLSEPPPQPACLIRPTLL